MSWVATRLVPEMICHLASELSDSMRQNPIKSNHLGPGKRFVACKCNQYSGQ